MKKLSTQIIALALTALMPRAMGGCGMWTVPVTFFDGVQEHGKVCISRQIGEVDLGQDLKLPLIINFRSDRESSSPTLGKGWILGLESTFVQIGENAFQMVQPDCWVRPFYRAKANDTLLDGGAWKAEIKGDTITAWASCGSKLVYFKGRLIAIAMPNRQLQLVYSGNKVVELREGGATKLTVEFDQTSGQARALVFNGKRIEITLDQRPRVQVIAGQNVIGGMDQSLRRLSGATEGAGEQFEFAVSDKVQPTLKITGKQAPERLFVWNAATRLITADGQWTYQITPAKALWENAAIGRKNGQGQGEFWHRDGAKGREITETIEGVRTVKDSFTSGLLGGRVRKIEESHGDSIKLVYQAAYDERGEKLRERLSDGTVVTYSADVVESKWPSGHTTTIQTLPKNHTRITTTGVDVSGFSLLVDSTGKVRKIPIGRPDIPHKPNK